ncbi:MAG TPA: response regulator transcription factor [Candidatus Acidoferrales bacterium]|nr:response regulator transcription factor [Candidatus Acidoferrales bacterium]
MAATRAIKVAVADDQPLYRMGVVKLLEAEEDLTLVAEATNGMEAILAIEKHQPDVLLLDLKMPVMDGLQALSEIGKRRLEARVIVMISNDEREKAVRAVRLGARGILFKDADPALLPKSIRKVYAGEVWIDNPILSQALESLLTRPQAPQVPAETRDMKLSGREMEVVRCVAMGLRNKEVADKLGVSEATIKNHLTSIYTKLGVGDRLELILYAIHNKLVHV